MKNPIHLLNKRPCPSSKETTMSITESEYEMMLFDLYSAPETFTKFEFYTRLDLEEMKIRISWSEDVYINGEFNLYGLIANGIWFGEVCKSLVESIQSGSAELAISMWNELRQNAIFDKVTQKPDEIVIDEPTFGELEIYDKSIVQAVHAAYTIMLKKIKTACAPLNCTNTMPRRYFDSDEIVVVIYNGELYPVQVYNIK
jgi:hypothetical protein